MGTRTFFRRGLCTLVAGLATGCATLTGRPPEPLPAPAPVPVYSPPPAGGRPDWPAPAEGKSAPGLTDHPVPHRPPPVLPVPMVTVEAEGPVVPASALQLPMVPPAAPPMTPPGQPGPVRPPAGGENPSLQPPRQLPPPDPSHGPTWKPAGPVGPHVRAFPTAAGARLGLAPWEVPADRVVELSRQLEAAYATQEQLLNRIRELEGIGAGREQALAEAFREAEAAAAEVARTRAQLREMSAEIAVLRAKVRQLEDEDIATLRAVIAALDRLLPAPPRRD